MQVSSYFSGDDFLDHAQGYEHVAEHQPKKSRAGRVDMVEL